MRRRLGLLLLLFAALPLGAQFTSCRHQPERAPGPQPTLIFDELAGFFGRPFPSDARRLPSGGPDFFDMPNPGGIDFVARAVEAMPGLDGFDPNGAIWLWFDRRLPFPSARDFDNVGALGGIELVDIDPKSDEYLRRYPLIVRQSSHHDSIRPPHVLQLLPVPGTTPREGTTFAVIVARDLNGDGTDDLGASPHIQGLLADDAPTAGDPAWRESFAPLRAALADLSLLADDVAAATVFTTGTPSARLFRWAEHAMKSAPIELVGPLVRERRHEGFTVLRGVVRMPLYQPGAPPHFFGGVIEEKDGLPVEQGTEEAPFYLTIPDGEVPADGLPHYFYIHGTGGLATQAIDRGYRDSPDDIPEKGSGVAGWVAPLGYATSCIAGTYSPDRIGLAALDGYAAYMFFNPEAMRDNELQMALEQVLFLRVLEELEIDPALVPDAKSTAPDGKIRFSKKGRIVGGQSLGSYLSGITAAITGVFDGAILTGAGGLWIEYAMGPKVPIDLQRVAEMIALPHGERLDRHHPFLTAIQNAAGPGDNVSYTPYLQRRPRDGAKVPHVLIIQGQRDLQVAVNLQRALVLSIGSDLVGGDVGDRPREQLEASLAYGGLRSVPGPHGGNRTAPDGTPRTSVVVRHLEDGILEGHYVLFQRPEPQEQLKAFVSDIRAGRVPTVR
jgi:hypothetical protein